MNDYIVLSRPGPFFRFVMILFRFCADDFFDFSIAMCTPLFCKAFSN